MASRSAPLGGWGINLGCGGRPERGWVNHDQIKHSAFVDVAWNLEQPEWPTLYEDVDTGEFLGTLTTPATASHRVHPIEFAAAKCRDVLEHIPPNLFFQTMNNLHGLLRSGAVLEVQVPEWGSQNALLDPTHWRGFHLDSFDILDPSTSFGRKNAFYGNRPWKILRKERVPRSTVNLSISLQRLK